MALDKQSVQWAYKLGATMKHQICSVLEWAKACPFQSGSEHREWFRDGWNNG